MVSLILSKSLDSMPVIPILFPIIAKSDNNSGFLKLTKETGISIYPLEDFTEFNRVVF